MRDALTGLATTRDLAERVAAASGFALWIDIDCLIWLNDQFGHDAGDAAIRTIAQAIRNESGCDSRDLHRVGGDEFIVLLGDIDEAAAIARATRIRDAIDALAIPYRRHDRPQADRLRTNIAAFAIARDALAASLLGSRFAAPLDQLFAEAVHREKLRSGMMAGVVVVVAAD
ncbi:MAG TPA: diguanylate cyclase [Xanthomonadaceae bacterium]|jgi:diguanylate cyclase (GGDEF)-like protein